MEMFSDFHHQCVSMKMMLILHLMFSIDHFHNKNKFFNNLTCMFYQNEHTFKTINFLENVSVFFG
jgi:hypothetical protein